MEKIIKSAIRKLYKEMFIEYSLRKPKNNNVKHLSIAINKNNLFITLSYFDSYEELDEGVIQLEDVREKIISISNIKDSRKLNKLPIPFCIKREESEFLLFIDKDKKILYNDTGIYRKMINKRIFNYRTEFQHNQLFIKNNDINEYLTKLMYTYKYETNIIDKVLQLLDINK